MAHPRRFRFGIQLSQPLEGMTWAQTAQHVESLGYSSLQMPDHFGDQLAPVPAMQAALDAIHGSLVAAERHQRAHRHAKQEARLQAGPPGLAGDDERVDVHFCLGY